MWLWCCTYFSLLLLLLLLSVAQVVNFLHSTGHEQDPVEEAESQTGSLSGLHCLSHPGTASPLQSLGHSTAQLSYYVKCYIKPSNTLSEPWWMASVSGV